MGGINTTLAPKAPTRFSRWLTPSTKVHEGREDSFGACWEEAVFDVGLLVIHLHDNFSLCRMTIVARESLEPDKPYMPPPNSQVFQLLDGAYITRLDACELDGAFVGVGFHTNRRVSQIYGRCESTRQFVEAPRGCYIHNVFGSTRGKDCTVLGAVFTPLGRLSAQVSRLPSADELVY